MLFVVLDSTFLFKFYLILLSQFKLVQCLTEHVLSANSHGNVFVWVLIMIGLIQDAAYATLCIRSPPQNLYATLSICVLHTFSLDVTLRDKAWALGIVGQFRLDTNSFACSLASLPPIFCAFVYWSPLSYICASWIHICAFQLIKFRVQGVAMHLRGVQG